LHPTCEVPPSNSSFHPDAKLPPAGFKDSSHSIQPPRTLVLDLAGDESQILARMKQKTRYNIKLAQKHGVAMRKSSDIHSFYQLMAMTGSRDGFHFHSLEYYRKAYELFHPRQECELFIAEYDNVLLAAVMVFAVGQRAWYFYGASSNENRELMATYMVQWQAIQWAKARGCLEYDLWGVPDMDRSVLEAKFTEIHHGLWGVYRFKRGFGGDLRRSAGPWDRIYSPVIYALYRWRTQKRIEGLAVT
jgi:lipid II:glycine glycyltransferase (peptidoglycan interpeptide bridge formation enzyme)